MNRTDRLLALVLKLQGNGRQRAEDLAASFETSKRTIYRDIQALSEAGVPVVSLPGQGYSLMKGYFLPPLSFTTDEATMLLMGADFVARSFDAEYRGAAHAACAKIEAVLPENLRVEVRYLQDSIRFIPINEPDRPGESEMLQQLRRAIIARRTARSLSHSIHRGRKGQTAYSRSRSIRNAQCRWDLVHGRPLSSAPRHSNIPPRSRSRSLHTR
jgi:predicted DNA-binding transcriptional regulator YafY